MPLKDNTISLSACYSTISTVLRGCDRSQPGRVVHRPTNDIVEGGLMTHPTTYDSRAMPEYRRAIVDGGSMIQHTICLGDSA